MVNQAPVSLNETERLKQVAELCPIENEKDETLDKIVRMVSRYFDSPISLVTIVGEHRQWFRARVGFDACETPRSESFCAYSTLTNLPIEILDTHVDERFKNNRLVVGPPFIRYYAGAPLVTKDGLSLGSLCIIDTKVRSGLSEIDALVLRDFAELVMLRISSLRSQNFVDQPTGLFNRLKLEADISKALLAGKQSQLVVVDLLDSQFLNNIVKALGYDFSQDFILQLKYRLQKILPEGSQLYKVGPTRIGFISDRVSSIVELCNPILKGFSNPVECRGIPLQLQIGVGVLPLVSTVQLSDDWIRLAVSAADSARERKQGWSLYEAKFDEAHKRAFMLLSSLMMGIRSKDQLYLAFQPKVDLCTGRCNGLEALVRWNHPELGNVSPAEFVPLAQKTALMESLTEWVLRAVVEQVSAWIKGGFEINVAMNVTVSDLESPYFVDLALKLFKEYKVPPSAVGIEFTESELMTNSEEVFKQLSRLRELGVEVAIDDFGTGYSNWEYLKSLPASIVKIDQSLIKNLRGDKKNERLIKTLIELAASLGLKVVAEGVETSENLLKVAKWGCSEAQGYLIAKPMDACSVIKWVSTGGFNLESF